MVGGAFSSSIEVVAVPLGGRVACLMKLIRYPLRTSERTSSGTVGWDKIYSRFPTNFAVPASAVLNFIPRSRIDDSAELRVR